MRRLNIRHVTEYRFSSSVSLLPHRLLLRPRESHNVQIESSILEIVPAHTLQWKLDVLNNSVAIAAFLESSDLLRISSNVIIQHYDDNPFDFLLDDYAVIHPFEYTVEDQVELAPFQVSEYPNDRAAVLDWLGEQGLARPMETFTLLDRMNRAISDRLVYQVREEPGVQSPAATLGKNSGSCRDFATLFMEACRHLGLASRFVSGYLPLFGTETVRGSTHAWAEVYLPGAGWKGFDPTSGQLTGNRHIAVAVARRPESVSPVTGGFIGFGNQRPVLSVDVEVNELSG